MKKIKLCVSYDGTDFCGWQKQKPHAHASPKPSIQETIEQALEKLFQEKISINGSGRTDSGVHALGQICDFQINRSLPQDVARAVQAFLPSTISVRQAWLAPLEFHSTLSATHKTYRYWIWNHKYPSALLDKFSWWIKKPLDLDYLNKQSEIIVGEHDFKSFQSVGTSVATTIRTIHQIKWNRKPNHIVEVQITGSGFLKQMVRNIVGTQVDFFIKNKELQSLRYVLEARDRKKAGPTAPAQGLYLKKVYYPQHLDKQCVKI